MARMGQHFGRWLKVRREASGLTVRKFAAAIGCSAASASLMERGQLRPGDDLQQRIAQVLNIDPDDVMLAIFPDEFNERQVILLRRWLCEGDLAAPLTDTGSVHPH